MKAGSNVYIFWFCWWRSFNDSTRFDLLRSKFACDTGVGHLSTDSIRRRRIIYPRANLNFKIGIEAAWQQDHVLMRRKKKCSQRPRRYKKVCDLVAPAMNLKDFSILRSLTDTGCSHHFKQQTQKKRKKKVVIILQNWNNLFEQMHPRWITHTYIEIWWTQPTAE